MANGKSTPQACKEAEIHTQTYYRWRQEYGGVDRSPFGLATSFNNTRLRKHRDAYRVAMGRTFGQP